MGLFVLDNVRLFAGGADFTSRSNKVELAVDFEAKDATNFGSAGWKEVMGGLASTALVGEGQWEAGDVGKVDDRLWAALGTVAGFTVCPDAAAVGDLAWLTQALQAKYALGGQVGDIAPWNAAFAGAWPLARGKVLHPPATARTVTGNGTAVEIAATAADQHVYATLHVLSVAGTDTPTLTVEVKSDVDALFNGSETSRITFSAATALGGQIQRLAGPVTDTFYRVTHTISGTNPSFLYLCALGVK